METPRYFIGTIYSSRDFQFNADQSMFRGTLEKTPGVLRDMWNDDMALGFGIRSAKTQRVVFFTLTGAIRDGQNHITAYEFDAVNPDDDPALAKCKARIHV